MTTEQLNKGKKIVAKARLLTKDIEILQQTTSTKIILVLADGHNYSVYVQDNEVDIAGLVHQLVISELSAERNQLHKEFEQL